MRHVSESFLRVWGVGPGPRGHLLPKAATSRTKSPTQIGSEGEKQSHIYCVQRAARSRIGHLDYDFYSINNPTHKMLYTSILTGLVAAAVPALAQTVPPSSFNFPVSDNRTQLTVAYTFNGNTSVVREGTMFGGNSMFLTHSHSRKTLYNANCVFQSLCNSLKFSPMHPSTTP